MVTQGLLQAGVTLSAGRMLSAVLREPGEQPVHPSSRLTTQQYGW